jgi:hypothetical protein
MFRSHIKSHSTVARINQERKEQKLGEAPKIGKNVVRILPAPKL